MQENSKKKKTIFIIWGVLLALIFVVGVIIFFKIDKLGDYKDQVSLGDKYLQELDYENAEICYLEAIRINEKNVKPYIQLSNVYVAQERFSEAEDILYQALENVEAKARVAVNRQMDYVVSEREKREETEVMATPTPEPTVEVTQQPTATLEPTAVPTQAPTPEVTAAPSILNDRESVRARIVDYYTQLWQPDGTYASFDHDDMDTAEGYMFVLRYQISDEAAAEKIARGGTVSANTYVTAVWVNTTTGEVTDEIDSESWYIE